MDGTLINVDVTAPGAIVALALMYMKVVSLFECGLLTTKFLRFCFEITHFAVFFYRQNRS